MLIEGQRLQGFAYVQGAWLHAGRISCPLHGDWLFSARDKLGRRQCDAEHRARHGLSIQALQDVLDHHANLEISGARWWIPDAGERLKAFESAIISATAGYSPPDEQWGPLRARDFLHVVQDVTTWSLSRELQSTLSGDYLLPDFGTVLAADLLVCPNARVGVDTRKTGTANAPVRQSGRATQCLLDHPGTARRRTSADAKNGLSGRSAGPTTSDLQGPESGRTGMACISNETVAREVQELLLGCLPGRSYFCLCQLLLVKRLSEIDGG